MKRECILSENELNKKRKIIQRNKIKKILNEAEQLTSEELSKLDHGNHLFHFCQIWPILYGPYNMGVTLKK